MAAKVTQRAPKVFLTADWLNLVMLNYVIDPAILKPLVPIGTELDFHHGDTFVSVVGFQFFSTRVLGFAIPFHQNFEEVNLRFYVRCHCEGEWRRGVVFVRELVPRRAIAFVARAFYGEPYVALPMRHKVDASAEKVRAEYSWRRGGQWESVFAAAVGAPQFPAPGSNEEFITEHYWGYTARKGRSCQYEVEHPQWKVWNAIECGFDADVAGLYGAPFVECLSKLPVSAFIAEGSAVTVRRNSDVVESARNI